MFCAIFNFKTHSRLRETRTKQLLKEMVVLGELEDDGKTKGRQYKIIRRK